MSSSRIFRFLALIITSICALSGFRAAGAAPISAPYVPGEVIVKYADGASSGEITALASQLNAVRVQDFSRIGASLEHLTSMTVPEAIALLSDNPLVEYIEPNYLYGIEATPDDPDFSLLWGMHNTGQTGGTPDADIDAPEAWDIFTGSTDVVVGVIDSGVDYTHPDLAANIWTNPGEIAGNGVDDDNNGYIDDIHGWDFVNNDNDPMDDHSHGTHCSGTIGGVGNNTLGVAGVNWHVRIMALKFLDASGGGTTAAAIGAIEYATMMGADLTSNSWGGGGYSAALEAAIEDAYAAGILFVAAAGNSGINNDVSPHYPSSYPTANIVAVGATDANDDPVSNSLWATNYGLTSVDVGAPGDDIYSTVPGGQYAYKSGTSMATPHVSGVLALIEGQFPNISVDAARTLLLNSADPKPSLANKWATGARVNARRALAGPDSIPPAAVSDLAVAETASNRALLVWTASGDDGLVGTATSYDCRYATYPLTEPNFDSALAVPDLPLPSPAGQPDTVTVPGLDFSTTYYFALKVRDEYGNTSPLSNGALTTTLGAPTIVTTPSSLSASLLTGEEQAQTITISNVGAGVLDFSARAIGASAPALAMRAAAAEAVAGITPSGTFDNDGVPLPALSPAEVGLLRDRLVTYGQTVTYGATSALPVIGIGGFSAPDLMLDLLGNTQLAGLYSFVEVDYELDDLSQLNGLILAEIDGGINEAKATVIRDFFDSKRGILLAMDDLEANWSPPVSTLLAPVFGISLAEDADFCSDAELNTAHPINEGIPEFVLGGAWCNDNDGFQLDGADWLFRNGASKQIFGAAYEGNARSVLMGENLVGVWAVNEQLNANAIIWLMKGGGIPRVSPASGAIPAGGSLDLTVTFDATDLCGGDYYSEVSITSNDPVNPAVGTSAVMTVTGVPDIDVSTLALDFGPVFLGGTVVDSVVVFNPGCDVIDVTNVAVDHADFGTDLTPFTLQVGESRTLLVTYAPVQLGPQSGSLVLSSNDPDQPTLTVSLQGEGRLAPVIDVSPVALTANLVTGGTDGQLLTVTNTGANDLVFKTSVLDATTANSIARISRGRLINAVPGGLAPSGSAGVSPLWSADVVPPREPLPAPVVTVPGALNTSLSLLLIANGNPTEIQTALLAYSDIAIVDTYNAALSVPDLAVLEAYHAVILINGSPYSDPVAMGNVLADYIDLGGGVIQTIASFVDLWEVQGRFLDEGYTAFAGGTGPAGDSQLGSFDANHPIMAGVTAAEGFLLATAPLTPGAQWVADWGFGEPFVATQGRSVVGVNVYLAEAGFWNGDIPLVLHNAALWASGGARWMAVDPDAGVVPAGTAQNLLVTFDAKGVCSGNYQGTVEFASNDPLTPVFNVAATMNVTGEPDISVSPMSLDYGAQFIGAVIADTVSVANDGCDLLTISAIASDNGDFSVSTGQMLIPAGEALPLYVFYAPTSVGPTSGVLSLTSDDPDQPVLNLTLAGAGLPAPVVGVSPTSLASSLLTGETESQLLTISNTGGSDLTFDLTATDLTGTTKVDLTSGRRLTPPSGAVANEALATGPALTDGFLPLREPFPAPTATIPGALASDLRILLVGNDALTEIQLALMAFSDIVAVDIFDTDLGTPTVATLQEYNAVLLANNHSFSDPVALGDVLADYVDLGGGVVQTEASFTSGWQLAGRFMAEGYSPFEIGGGPVFITASLGAFQAGHPIMAGVGAVTNGLWSTVPLAAGAQWVADWDVGEVFVATQGQSVVGVNGFVAAPGFWTGDMPLVLHNALVWVGGAARWLAVDPDAGTVAPGDALDVLVTFDATDVCGGDYVADILVASNDPLTPDSHVPALLTVSGVPNIAVPDTLLDFGSRYLGAVVVDSVLVDNPGCDVLAVSAIATTGDAFSADPTPFALAAGESRMLEVLFTPTAVGPATGTLSLTSNDPDQPVVEVALVGEGVTPPVISVNPTALDVTLYTDGTETRQLTIANSGGSPLVWSLNTFKRDSLTAVAQAAAAAVVAGLTPVMTNDEDGPVYGVLTATDQIELANRLAGYRQVVATENLAALMPTVAVGGSYGSSLIVNMLANSQLSGLFVFDLVDYEFDDLTTYAGLVLAEGDAAITLAKATAIRSFFDSGKPVFIGMDDFDAVWYAPVSDLLAPVFGISGAFDADLCANAELNTTLTLTTGLGGFTIGGAWCNENDRFVLAGANWLFRDSTQGNVFGAVYEAGARSVIMGENLSFVWTANEQLNANALIWMMAGGGLPRVDPIAGVVPSGGNQVLDVFFSAEDLCGGDFLSDLVISSDDPLQPEWVVPADMHVIGAPVITLPDSVIVFGDVFVGYTGADTLVVENLGCGPLNISGVSFDNPVFSSGVSSFVVPAEGRYDLPLTFTPGGGGAVVGQLTLVSNDQIHPATVVALTGTGRLAPDGGLAPPQISASLGQGETAVEVLTLTNSGAGELLYSVSTENAVLVGGAAAQAAGRSVKPIGVRLNADIGLAEASPDGGTGLVSRPDSGLDSRPAGEGFAKATGAARSLPIAYAKALPSAAGLDLQLLILGSGDLAEIQTALAAYPGITTVDFFNSELGTPTLSDLVSYNVVIVANNYTYLNPVATGDVLADYVDIGGGIIQTEASFVQGYSLAGRFMDEGYAAFGLATGPVGPASLAAFDSYHGIMAGVTTATCALTSNTNLAPGAQWVADWDNGRTMVATNGNQVVGLNAFFAQPGNWTGDIDLILYNAVTWLASRVPWLEVTPMAGIVPPGGSVGLMATFAPGSLDPGQYQALIRVSTNDPVTPVFNVDAGLTVNAVQMSVGVTVSAGGVVDEGNVLGVADTATDGFDGAHDVPEPPHAPGNYVAGYFSHPEWNTPLGDRFMTDIRAPYDPASDLKTWPFVVETDLADSVTIAFAPSFGAGVGWQLWLRDEATGAMRNLFPSLSYTFQPTGGARAFTIYVGEMMPPLDPVERQLASGWSLLGTPLVPAPGQDTWDDVLLGAAPGLSYLYDFQGDIGYAGVAGSDVAGQGQGVWLATTEGFTWAMNGNPDGGTVAVPALVGWNLVGYPLWVGGDLAGVSVAYNGQQYLWQDAVDLNLVSPFVYDYEDSTDTYRAVSALEPWHGYWMAAHTSGVAIQFNYRSMMGLTVPARSDAFAASRLPYLVAVDSGSEGQQGAQKAAAPGWQLNLSLAAGGQEVAIGRSVGATVGFDAGFDLPVPPASPAGVEQTRMLIRHPEWNVACGDNFYTDLVDPLTEPQVWSLTIARPEPGQESLHWDRFALPEGVDLEIYLPHENRVAVPSVRSVESTTLEVGTEPILVQIRATGGVSDVPYALAGLQLRNVPNPFNPMTEFRFNLPRGAETEIRIFDVRGAVVHRVQGGVMAAGPSTLRWAGRDGQGRTVASGIYFYRLYLDNQQEGPTLKMSLIK